MPTLLNCQGKSIYQCEELDFFFFHASLLFSPWFIYIIAWGKQDTGDLRSLSKSCYPFCQISKIRINFSNHVESQIGMLQILLTSFFSSYILLVQGIKSLILFLNNIPLIHTAFSSKSSCICCWRMFSNYKYFSLLCLSILGQFTYYNIIIITK